MPRRIDPSKFDRSLLGYSAKDFRRMGFDEWELPGLLNIRRLFRRSK